MRRLISERSKLANIIIFILVLFSILLITFSVYMSGGTSTELDHLMYFPIIFSGLFLGCTTTTFFTIIAGILLGPWMPFSPQVPQEHLYWGLRLIAFIAVAFETCLLRRFFVSTLKDNQKLYTHHASTNIPNSKIIGVQDFNNYGKEVLITSIIIDRYEELIFYFGEEIYGKLLEAIYDALNENIIYNKTIFSNNSNFIGLIVDHLDDKKVRTDIIAILRNLRKTFKYPIYFEFSMGMEK